MGRRLVLTVAAAIVALLLVPMVAQAAAMMPVHRFYNLKTGVHFYTADEAEKANVLAKLSSTYQYDGVGYWVDTAHPANSAPLYRFYNFKKGVHFYTASEAERNNVINNLSGTYEYEGVAYKVALDPNQTPVFRFYNPKAGVHFYTATQGERDYVNKVLACTYKEDGVNFFIAGVVPGFVQPPLPPPSYIANSSTLKFHRPSCYWVTQIKPEHVVNYYCRTSCLLDGYVACQVCKP